jgi:hypothetical protein
MAELQQTTVRELTAAPGQGPGTLLPVTPPPPPGTPVTGQVAPLPGGPATTNLDLSKFTTRQLRQMLQELRNQRSDYASRRTNLADGYESSSGANRQGMGDRLNTIDGIIIRYENEMARVGNAIVARGGETTEQVPNGNPGAGWVRDDDAAGMAFGFSFATMVLTFFVVRRFMRRKYAGGGVNTFGRQQPANLIASNERLERIEQAVDSIAIEVERVSENQRFMTRLMTETQLGDTIKDVRKSAELAKSAAESSSR